MKKVILFVTITLLGLGAANLIQAYKNPSSDQRSISGEISQGYRILKIENTTEKVDLKVYRGDYIKFDFDPSMNEPALFIPKLSINQKLTRDLVSAPFFKMKKTGRFPFSLGRISGYITVIAYKQANYKEVTSSEAATLIKKAKPLILDVRTPREFKRGHLKDAVLIPVQELEKRMKEILGYKDRDILIYCATGNRSTVASKILNDSGFKQIYNLRYGIYRWYKEKFPVIR